MRIQAFDPAGVLEVGGEGRWLRLRPWRWLAAVLWAARDLGADSVQILRHATSADVTGDYASVVGGMGLRPSTVPGRVTSQRMLPSIVVRLLTQSLRSIYGHALTHRR